MWERGPPRQLRPVPLEGRLGPAGSQRALAVATAHHSPAAPRLWPRDQRPGPRGV